MTRNFHLENGILTVDEGTVSIKDEQFAENPEIEKVILPEGLEAIGVAAFSACENLHEINIPSTVRRIGDGAFLYDDGIENVILPEGLEEICDLSFQATGIRRITVPASVSRIGEEAFFECLNLTEINILGRNTVIQRDAFACDFALIKGYVAPGFPEETTPGSELLYSLLWAGCTDRHDDIISERAERFIRENEMLVMEKIFKTNNTAAMSGISSRHLLNSANIDAYVREANREGFTELTALLIKAKNIRQTAEEEFEL